MQAEPEPVAEVEAERRHLGLETDLGGFRKHLRHLVGADAGLQHRDRAVHPVARALVRVDLRARRPAHREGAVVAGAIAHERMDDVEIRLVAGTDQPVGEIVRVRAAALAGDRVDRLDAIRAHLIQALGGERHDLAFLDAGLQRRGDVHVNTIDHGAGGIEQRDLVVALHLARAEHHLLAVANIESLLLEREEHAGLAQVQAERHLRDTLLDEDVLDLLRRGLEEPHLGPDRAAHPGIARVNVIFMQPRAIELVVPRRRSEIPPITVLEM